ncbi:hypothetical protein N665_0722s0007 [Sinapis alba]|nr:hypothetical protein N665_0722s0007 [Sinapis alba]
MIEGSTNLDWYKGTTLLEVLGQINEPSGPQTSPSVFHSRVFKGCIGTVPVGRVEWSYTCFSGEVRIEIQN